MPTSIIPIPKARDAANRVNQPVRIDPGETPTRISNPSNITVYYKSTDTVSDTSNDGTLTQGQTLTLTTTEYLLGAERTEVLLDIAAPSGPPSLVVLSADTANITASTTLVNVGLAVPIGGSTTEIWFFEAFLIVNAGNATMDSKFGFTVPASATMLWGTASGLNSEIPSFGARGSANTPNVLQAESGNVQPATNTGITGLSLAGMIFGGGTGGNVQLQFAQATSDAGNLKLQKGSFLRYSRVQA